MAKVVGTSDSFAFSTANINHGAISEQPATAPTAGRKLRVDTIAADIVEVRAPDLLKKPGSNDSAFDAIGRIDRTNPAAAIEFFSNATLPQSADVDAALRNIRFASKPPQAENDHVRKLGIEKLEPR